MAMAGSDITAAIARGLLIYVSRAVGQPAGDQVIAAAGLDPSDPRFHSGQHWFRADELAALFDAAAACTGDTDLGRRIGEELFHRDEVIGNHDFLRAGGTPHAAFDFIAEHTGLMVTVRRFEVVERGDTHVVIDSVPLRDDARQQVLCQIAAGYWAHVPELFGTRGTAVEERCAARGDNRCRLVMRWDDPVSASADERQRSRRRADGLIGRFETMQAMAAELATIDDLGQASRRIIERAGAAMLTSRFVLTVREHEQAAPQTFCAGISDGEGEIVAGRLWDGETLGDGPLGRPVVAEVASRSHRFGHLVAFLPEHASVRTIDHRLLGAYAGHAAATIERVVTMAAARREHRTVRALLGLSHSLAGARSIGEVTELVTTAVEEITGFDVCGVWLLNEDAASYRLQTVHEPAGLPGPRVLRVEDPEGPRRLATDPQPFVVRRSEATGDLADVLDGWGVEECQVAPIVHREQLHGLLVASSTTPLPGNQVDGVLDAISALAHHAGTAIANTVLLEQIRHQALHDALTGLPNRPQVEDRARQALAQADRRGSNVGIAFVDLDRFKHVNDTLGHVAGDDLIGRVGDRIGRHLRPSDVVARLGGDEFLLLLPDLDHPGRAEEIVQRVLDALRTPFHVAGESLFVTASVGIACYPEHGRDYGTLLARADAAMYVAKGRGRNRHAVHDAATTGHGSVLKLESALHRAVERDELRLRFQPQVDLLTDEIIAAEALVRWEHPTMGLVGPATFLAVAEESGLIVDIDRWVRRVALSQAAEWARRGTPIRVAVNVSRRDLAEPGLVAEVAALLDELDLTPELVEMEITDRIVMADEDLPPSVAGLRDLGVRLAVDDFGTGSSVLSRLHHCPVDVLKVDRIFVEPLSGPRPDTRLVDGLVSMAHALGMEVVIEGIEDEEQAHAVRLLGADLGQGFHHHEPMAAGDLTALLDLHAERGLPAGVVRPLGGRRARRARR